MAAVWRVTFVLLACAVHAATAQNILTNLQIGFFPNTSNVALNGVTTPQFNYPPQVGLDELTPEVTFYLFLTPNGPQQSVDYEVVVGVSSTDIGFNIVRNSRLVTTNAFETTVQILFHCQANATAGVEVMIDFPGLNYEPLTIYLNKTCVIRSPRGGFTVGTTNDGQPTAVQDGVGIPTFEFFTVQYEPWTLFYVWQNAGSRSQRFDVRGIFGADAEVMSPQWSVSNNVAHEYHLGQPTATINVTYNCRPMGIGKGSSLQLSIAVAGYNDVFFTWTKLCLVAPPDNHPGGGGGWPAVGIFFFVVFMLLITGCFAGCLYNKFGLQKSGWDLVPGIGLWRKCTERCFSAPRYTPQADFEAHDSYGSTSSGGRYQTQL